MEDFRRDVGPDERRERRKRRREKQRAENLGRAKKMHAARLAAVQRSELTSSPLEQSVYVGCSGWFYWK